MFDKKKDSNEPESSIDVFRPSKGSAKVIIGNGVTMKGEITKADEVQIDGTADVKMKTDNLNGMKLYYKSDNEITVLYERKKHKIDQIINKVKNAGMEIYDISTNEGNLEDVFIDLTKS